MVFQFVDVDEAAPGFGRHRTTAARQRSGQMQGKGARGQASQGFAYVDVRIDEGMASCAL
jgi:hypothetical protein